MLFVLEGVDAPNSLPKRKLARPAHLARVQVLLDANRLVIAGPMPSVAAEDPSEAGFTGSLIIAEFASQQEAENWLSSDPYTIDGIFERISVRPFRKVLP
jgi:uncharacterized protein